MTEFISPESAPEPTVSSNVAPSTAPVVGGANSDMMDSIRSEHNNQDSMVEEVDHRYAGKYNSVETLEAGYKELQSAFDKRYAGFNGKPEEYSYDMAEGMKDTGIEHKWDDPAVSKFRELAGENEMSQEMFEKTLDIFYAAQAESQDTTNDASVNKADEYYNEQIDALGGDAQKVEARVEDIVSHLATLPGVSNDDVIQVVEGLQNAGQVVALEKIIQTARSSSSLPSSSASPLMGEEQVRDLMKDAMSSNGMDRDRKMEHVSKIMEQRYPGMASR